MLVLVSVSVFHALRLHTPQVTVEPGVLVRGPAIIEDRTTLRHGAYGTSRPCHHREQSIPRRPRPSHPRFLADPSPSPLTPSSPQCVATVFLALEVSTEAS